MDARADETRDPLESRCVGCDALLAIRAGSCPTCGRPALDPESRDRIATLTSRLAGRWGDDPYFRSAEGISYTPRRQLRGFLEAPRHALGEALLGHLFRIALLVDPHELRRALHASERELPAHSGRLAQTLRHLFRSNREALHTVAALPQRDVLRRRLLETVTPERDERLAAAFRSWRRRAVSGGE
jgi:hypothetical protein